MSIMSIGRCGRMSCLPPLVKSKRRPSKGLKDVIECSPQSERRNLGSPGLSFHVSPYRRVRGAMMT